MGMPMAAITDSLQVITTVCAGPLQAEIRQAVGDVEAAQSALDNAGREYVEAAIYQLTAARMRLDALVREAKQSSHV